MSHGGTPSHIASKILGPIVQVFLTMADVQSPCILMISPGNEELMFPATNKRSCRPGTFTFAMVKPFSSLEQAILSMFPLASGLHSIHSKVSIRSFRLYCKIEEDKLQDRGRLRK
jgi:hypothetical protein